MPSCKVCRLAGSADLRRRWGCDEAAEGGDGVFATSCPRCAGRRSDCGLCSGTGSVEHDRCPAVAGAEAGEFLAAYLDVVNGYGMPAPGGLGEQAAFFADALHVADGERGRIQEEQQRAGRELRDALQE